MQRLTLSPSFHLALTPSLKEAISLLQLSAIDLLEKVQSVCENNPFIEMSLLSTCSSHSTDFDTLSLIADPSSSSLHFFLTQSLICAKLSPEAFSSAKECIADIDEKGFFPALKFHSLSREIQEEIDSWLYTVTPLGLGARSLSQCLQWQLSKRDDLAPQRESFELLSLLQILSQDSFSLPEEWISRLKEPRFEKVLSSLSWDPAQVWHSTSSNSPASQISPVDLIIFKENQTYKVHLNPELRPHLLIHSWPQTLSKKHPFRTHYQQALLFQKILRTRDQTLERAATYIVQHQQDFFRYGKHASKGD